MKYITILALLTLTSCCKCDTASTIKEYEDAKKVCNNLSAYKKVKYSDYYTTYYFLVTNSKNKENWTALNNFLFDTYLNNTADARKEYTDRKCADLTGETM